MSVAQWVAAVAGLWLLASPAGAQDRRTLLDQATAAYARGDYAVSADLFARAIEAGAEEPNVFYNAACSQALAGRAEEAFASITRALQAGYADIDHLESDPDFESLHADPRWGALLAEARESIRAEREFWGGAAFKTPYQADLTADEKAAGLAKLWAEVKFNFANFELVPELDWDSLFVATLPRVRSAGSTEAYYRILMEVVAQLGDGHTNVIPPRELNEAFFAAPMVRTRLVEGRVLLLDVHDDSLLAAGIRPGMEIAEVGGLPVREYAERFVRPYQCASTTQDLDVRTYEYRLLSGALDEPVLLKLLAESGAAADIALPRLRWEERRDRIPTRTAMDWRMMEDGTIAVVALNSFGGPEAADRFEADFAEISKAEAIVLDLRENGGGNSGVGYRVLSRLVDGPFLTSEWHTREYRPSFRAWGNREGRYDGGRNSIDPSTADRFLGPVVLLTSPRTYSAAEDLAVAFDAAERGEIIGESTGGSTGQPLLFDLPGGGSARVCTKHDRYPDGRAFVGHGVQPDRLVAPTVADVRAGRDTVLEVAIERLRAAGR